MYWIETRIQPVIFQQRQIGHTLIECIKILFEEFDYTNTENSNHIEILGYTEIIPDDNYYNEPLIIYIAVNGNGKFDEVLYKEDEKWSIHKKFTKYLKKHLKK